MRVGWILTVWIQFNNIPSKSAVLSPSTRNSQKEHREIDVISASLLTKEYLLFRKKAEEVTLVHSATTGMESDRTAPIDLVVLLQQGAPKACTCTAKWTAGRQGNQHLYA